MGFFDRGQRQPSIRQSSIMLTERGRARLQQDFTSGDPLTRVLTAIETYGGSAGIEEISSTTGITVGQLEHIIPRAVHRGFIQANSGGMEQDNG